MTLSIKPSFQTLIRPAVAACLGLCAPLIYAGAKTDGSVGAIQALSGNFTIPQTLGTIKGGNLFHSFQTFSINSGESATFTTTSALQNVISRVTGGAVSNIDGLLKLDAAPGSAPNFFFINPAGVIFGSGASLDVPANFHVSTAQQLKFADGFVWNTASPSGSSLTTAAPESFGFLGGGSVPAKVVFNNLDENGVAASGLTHLKLKPGSSFDVAAGSIVFNSAVVAAPGGAVQLSATGVDAASVPLNGLPATDLNGAITINNASVDTSGTGGGKMLVSGGDISVVNGGLLFAGNTADTNPSSDAGITLRANNLLIDSAGSKFTTEIGTSAQAKGNSGNIDINARGQLSILNDGHISSSVFGADGSAGDVSIHAAGLKIDNGGNSAFAPTIESAESFAGGHAGNIVLRVDGQVAVLGTGQIVSSSLESPGNAGNITMTAAGLRLDSINPAPEPGAGTFDGAYLPSYRAGIIASGGTFTQVCATCTAGQSGAIAIKVTGQIDILSGATISATTIDGIKAGNVDITAGKLTIDGKGVLGGGIETGASGTVGAAGAIAVRADELDLIHGGSIHSDTATSGNAGNVSVIAGQLNIDSHGSIVNGTGIFSETSGSGNAGDLSVQVSGNAALLNAGRISSSTFGKGKAGSIDMAANNLLIAGNAGYGSSIDALASSGSSGQTGNIKVTIGDSLTMADQGQISIRNDAIETRPAGKPSAIVPSAISVTANTIALNNAAITAASSGNIAASNINLTYAGRATLAARSAVNTSAVDGNGGKISITGGGALLLDHSQITTSVSGTSNGNGGDISVNAPSGALVLNTGFIQANTAAKANGGNVAINVDAVLPSADALNRGGVPVAFDPTRFGYNVIQAAAPDGVSGAVQISSPQIDLSGTLASLSTQLIDFGNLGMDLCRIGSGSSLTPLGHGGLPPTSSGRVRPAGGSENYNTQAEP